MLSIEQFVYTTASTENSQGYQIVAKSDGITADLLSKIESYLYPIDIIPDNFTESRSLVVLKKKRTIIFSKIRNIGIGYDGRNNTLYNHSLVMSTDEFSQIDSDTRILEDFYFEDYEIRGSLPQLKINPQKSTISLEKPPEIQKILPKIFRSIFNKKKILITNIDDYGFIQYILGLIPPSMRQISFSTTVVDIKKQPEYEIIMSKFTPQERFHTIDIESFNLHSTSSKLFEEGINQYMKIISSNAEKIQKFFNQFDKMMGKPKDKLLVLVYLEMINSIHNKSMQEKYVHILLEHLNKIEPLTALDVFEKIKDKIPSDEILIYAPRFEIPKIIYESKNMEINKYMIEKILNQVSDGTSNSRLMLLNKVIDVRNEEFLENGAQLLNDTRNSYYKPDIYKIFVENDYLHKCIFEIFESNSNVSDFNKKQIFEDIFLLALEIKPELVMLLLNYMVYDLTEKYDAENFEKIIKKLNKKHMLLNFDKEFDICAKVFLNIENSAKTLNIFENPESIKQLVKSTKLLTEFVNNTSWDDELDDLQRNKLIYLKTTMGQFINKNNKKGLSNFFD